MPQNITSKEIQQIELDIDEEIERIDHLLSLLTLPLTNLQTVSAKQWQSSQNPSHQLNETCEETDYHNTGISTTYHFQQIYDYYAEEILLDDYHYLNRYAHELSLKQPKIMHISTKGNWINNFLDQKDCQVIASSQDQTILLENIENGCFIGHKMNNFGKNKKLTLIQSQKIYRMQSLNVKFPNHLQGYQLNLQVEEREIVYELTIRQRVRLLIECPSKSGEIIRFLMIKVSEDEKYEIVWGAYSLQTIFESLALQCGKYILLPLPGGHFCNIYLQNKSSLIIKQQSQFSLKTFALLKECFQQTQQSFGLKRTLSIQPDDDSKKQFARSCYMNYGIIIQIYENIYQYEVKFIDEEEQLKQDMQLLFQEIYTYSQIENRYCVGEKVFKFYVINKKPANLYVPRKRVLMGNRIMENYTFHSVFK